TTFLALTGRHYDALNASDLTQWLLQLVLLNAWKPGYDAWNVPSWSISAEMFAYLLFPAIVAAHVLRGRLTRAALLVISVGFYLYIAATCSILVIIAGLAALRCIGGFGLGLIGYLSCVQILRWLDILFIAVPLSIL